MFHQVLVVCHANICRSPIAEAFLNDRLSDVGVQAKSAGIKAANGQTAAPWMQTLATEQGLDLSTHRSRLLDDELVSWADLILVMDLNQQKAVESKFPASKGAVQLLGKWDNEDVLDPYGGNEENYRQCCTAIDKHVSAWIKRIWSE